MVETAINPKEQSDSAVNLSLSIDLFMVLDLFGGRYNRLLNDYAGSTNG